jgi:hypothetical protein
MLENLRHQDGELTKTDILSFEEDFVGGINTFLWNLVVGLSGSQATIAMAGGARRLSTGLLALGDVKLALNGGALVRRDRAPLIEGRIRVAPTGALTNMTVEAGAGDNSTGAFLQYDPGSSANWRAVTRLGGTTTATASSVAVVANTFVKYRIEFGAANVKFYLNEALFATHTTNLPGASTYLDLVAGRVTSTLLADRTLDVDYVRVWSPRDT